MKSLLMSIGVLTLLLLLSTVVFAQTDNFGVLDTVYADVAKINDLNWSVTLSYANDQNVVALSLPIKLDAGENKIVADSAVYVGGRAEMFSYKGFRPDTSEQCVTMGLIANLGPSKRTMKPGRGRIVTVFISSLNQTPIENLTVDTTTTHPNNSLVIVADRFQGDDGTDTIPMQNRRILQIKPAWVVRRSQ